MKKRHQQIHFLDYYAFSSALHSWNACYKAIFAITNVLVCILAENWLISVVIALSMAYLIVGKGKLHFDTYIRLLKIPIVFMLFSGIAIAVNLSGSARAEPGISLGFCYVYMTEESVKSAINVFLKAFGAVSAMYMLTLTTTSDEVISVLKKCHVPKLIIELMYLIYRYIFVLLDVHAKMKDAARSRAGERDFKTSCHTFGNIANNLFLISIKKAGIYYDAMIARGYYGELVFLETEKKITKAQIIGAGIYFLLLGSLIYLIKCIVRLQ